MGAGTRIGVGTGVGLGVGVASGLLAEGLAPGLELAVALDDGDASRRPTGARRSLGAGAPRVSAPVPTPPTATTLTRASVAAAALTDRLIVRTPGTVLVVRVAWTRPPDPTVVRAEDTRRGILARTRPAPAVARIGAEA